MIPKSFKEDNPQSDPTECCYQNANEELYQITKKKHHLKTSDESNNKNATNYNAK